MALPTVVVNNVAVLVAAIVAMVIGGIWHSPMVFGNLWMKLSGLTAKSMDAAKKKGMAKLYIYQFIAILVAAYVLAYFVKYAGAATASDGALVGFWAWLGFVATTTVGSTIWEGKSFKLWLLNNGHNLLTYAVMGAILAVWV